VPVKGARRHVNSGQMAEPHVYQNSPIVQSRERNPVLGSFAPDSLVRSGVGPIRLRTLFGSGFVVLHFAPDPAAATEFRTVAVTVPTAVPVTFLSVLPDASPDGPAVISDVDGSARGAFRAQNGDWFLIRPDGHVAYTGNGDATEIADAVRNAVRAVQKPAHQGATR
jgi:3-(3-hydroxy-phenyl)propionate hydroxylase